jgi:transaldolase
MTSPLEQLAGYGQSVWIDFLSRDLLRSGSLARAIERDGVVGVTSNPTIFAKALANTDAYDEQLAGLWTGSRDVKDVFLQLATTDVQRACDLLLPAWQASNGLDGYVSIEVDPRLAYDSEATVREAMLLHAAVLRSNVLVKIPATKEGLAAIEEMTARGKSINVTLIFSLDRYGEVVEAYLRGLECYAGEGGDPSSVTSVASFFVSRVDTETDKRLDGLGAPETLKGRLAVANARLAYHYYKDAFSGPRWEALAMAGARKQRPLWASISVKDPRYRDTRATWRNLSVPRAFRQCLRRRSAPFKTMAALQRRWSGTSTRRGASSQNWLERVSFTTMSWRHSKPRAWRSSSSRSPSCLKVYARRCTTLEPPKPVDLRHGTVRGSYAPSSLGCSDGSPNPEVAEGGGLRAHE